MSISDEELLKYNRQGIIPGPHETESGFQERVEACLKLKETLRSKDLGFPFLANSQENGEPLQEAFQLTLPLFDIAPSWVPIFYSSDKLPFWQAASTWIFKFKEEGPLLAFLQLRNKFKNSSKSFIYSREEILSHELAHACRMSFHQPKFEELLAFQTSPYLFRKWLGPIVQEPWEPVVLILLLMGALLLDVSLFFFNISPIFYLSTGLKLSALSMILLGVIRVLKRGRQFTLAKDHLNEILGKTHLAQAVLFRLKDEEIILFSKLKGGKILEWIQNKKNSELRWKLISLAYFDKVLAT